MTVVYILLPPRFEHKPSSAHQNGCLASTLILCGTYLGLAPENYLEPLIHRKLLDRIRAFLWLRGPQPTDRSGTACQWAFYQYDIQSEAIWAYLVTEHGFLDVPVVLRVLAASVPHHLIPPTHTIPHPASPILPSPRYSQPASPHSPYLPLPPLNHP